MVEIDLKNCEKVMYFDRCYKDNFISLWKYKKFADEYLIISKSSSRTITTVYVDKFTYHLKTAKYFNITEDFKLRQRTDVEANLNVK